MSEGAVSVDGHITKPGEAHVAAMDHGFLFGDSVYEVVRSFRGRPVAYPEHLGRLRRSAAAIYMDIALSDDEIRERVRETVTASGLEECYVRIVVTRGSGPMTLLPEGCPSRTLVVFALPLQVPSAADVANGVGVAVPDRIRNDQRALAPAAKTGNYLNNLLALVEAQRAGETDAVLVNADGHVTEATTANVFWARGGELRTPSAECGILAGITRELLLAELADEGLSAVEGRYPLDDLLSADEAFVTGTVKGVLAVVRVAGEQIGSGRPGPLTRRAAELYERAMERHSEPW